MEQVSLRHIKTKGDLKSDDPDKKKDDIGAEKILEQAGLKGAAAGGVEVSSRHANFVVAHPGATSDDVFRLVDMLREKVAQTVGVELEYHFEIW